jgi:prevent-host-death family protein
MTRDFCGAKEARAHLPELLERAHHGTRTVITRYGRPYAALVPAEEARVRRRVSVLALKGTGAGFWGKEPALTGAQLRDEWR